MAAEPSPRVLLGLGPIMRLGMARFLAEAGCEVIGHEDRPGALPGAAARLRPDLVVLDLDGGSSQELARLVSGAAPDTTVVLLSRGEDAMEVLDPSGRTSPVAAPVVEHLRGALHPAAHVSRVKE